MRNLSRFSAKSGSSSYNAFNSSTASSTADSSTSAPTIQGSSVSKAGEMPMGQSSICNLGSMSEEQMKEMSKLAKGDWFATQYRPGVCIKRSNTDDLKSISEEEKSVQE